MLLERRFETAPLHVALDLAGENCQQASAAETWTALPYVGEAAFSDRGLHRGTDYMRARNCSPLTGRFLSVDPLVGAPAFPQAWNRYAYALGNPMRYVDPTGRSSDDTITVTAEDPCPSAPDGVSCEDYQRILQSVKLIGLRILADLSRQISFGDDSPAGPNFIVGIAMGNGGSGGGGRFVDGSLIAANSATAAGNLKVLKIGYLKNLNLDAEAAKQAWLGTDSSKFNIAIDGARKVYFVPVRARASAPIPTGRSIEDLAEMFPRLLGK